MLHFYLYYQSIEASFGDCFLWHASCHIASQQSTALCAICTNHVVILKEDTMKSSIRDKAEGAFHELKGTAKEISGILNEDPELEAEGADEKIAGKVQKKVGQIKTVLGK